MYGVWQVLVHGGLCDDAPIHKTVWRVAGVRHGECASAQVVSGQRSFHVS